MRSRTWLIAALLAGSGFCALVYQIAWLRDFRLIFGASTLASAAVLAIFIGGLGAGGLLLGPRADTHRRPLAFYALLETIVALSAAVSPLLLMLVRSLYLATGGSLALGSAVATIGRLVLTAIVLAIPTVAMGATLPAAARAATRETDERRRDVAALYALNTLGAVVGCVVATFWMLERFGTHRTIWIAVVINLLVAALAFGLDRMSMQDLASTEHPEPRTQNPASRTRDLEPDTRNPAPVWFLLASSATVGFAFFLLELIWYRLLGPLLGGSVFTFGLILAVALAGVGLGGLLYALFASDERASLSGFATTCLLEAFAVGATFALGDRVALLAATLLPFESSSFTARAIGWATVAGVVVLPAALVAGYQFPLLIALFGRAREAVGRQIGLAYAANTVGAIVGSLAGGFGLLPFLSAPGAWQLVGVVLLLLGAGAAVMGFDRTRMTTVVGHGALAVVTVFGLVSLGPTAVWRHSGIGAGRVTTNQIFGSPNQLRDWIAEQRRAIVWDADGTESAVALSRDAAGYSFFVNGKADGSARADAGTQVMLALLGAIQVPNLRQVLVVGLGTGSTAGWLGAIPTVDRVHVVELEPLIVEVARACAVVNRDVLRNPKVQITIGDAREALLTTRERYDLIASEPSNPYRAGIASLFTQEYYRAAADRLNEDGVFVQWVQAYEIDASTLRTVYATLGSVFPNVETWYTNPGDIALVASKHARTHSVAELSRRMASEPYRSALALTWRAVDIQGFLGHYLANPSFARSVANVEGVDINTDDRNVVEFGLARSVGRALTTVTDIRDIARAAGASRPPLDNPSAIRWDELDTAYMSYNAATGAIDNRYSGPPNEQARQAALAQYYLTGNVDQAREFWGQQNEDARDPTEMAMLADITATAGIDGALYFIDRLRPFQPNEANVLLATLRMQQMKFAEAATAVEAALIGLRTDPWPQLRYADRAVAIADLLVQRDPSLTDRLFNALSQPFAVQVVEDHRLVTRAVMTRQRDFPGRCVAALGPIEPNVPWNENFLRLRYECYEATKHPRFGDAERDLRAFIDSSPRALLPSVTGVR